MVVVVEVVVLVVVIAVAVVVVVVVVGSRSSSSSSSSSSKGTLAVRNEQPKVSARYQRQAAEVPLFMDLLHGSAIPI